MTCWRTRDRSAPELHEHLGGDALALTDEAEEDVLGADVVVAELQRLAQRQLEHLLGPGREGDVPGRRRAALADDLLDLAADGLEGDAERLEGLGGDALALVDQPEQDVLGADVVVVEEARFLLGQDDDPAGPVGEAFEQGDRLYVWTDTWASVPGPCGPSADASEPGRPDGPMTAALPHVGRARLGLASASRGHRRRPLLALPRDGGRPGRVEAALRAAVRTERRLPHRDRQPPDRRRRQAAAARCVAVAAARHRPAAGAERRRRPRAAWPVELVHLGSLYHDDVMDEADTRRSVESVNARWGNLRPSSPATSCWPGRRRSPPRSAPRSPACWPAPSAGCARARSRELRHGLRRRAAPRRATSRRSRARRRRCSRPPAASAAIVGGLDRDRSRRAHRVRPRLRHGRSRSSTTCSTSSPPRPSWASRPATTWSRASTRCRSSARWPTAARAADELRRPARAPARGRPSWTRRWPSCARTARWTSRSRWLGGTHAEAGRAARARGRRRRRRQALAAGADHLVASLAPDLSAGLARDRSRASSPAASNATGRPLAGRPSAEEERGGGEAADSAAPSTRGPAKASPASTSGPGRRPAPTSTGPARPLRGVANRQRLSWDSTTGRAAQPRAGRARAARRGPRPVGRPTAPSDHAGRAWNVTAGTARDALGLVVADEAERSRRRPGRRPAAGRRRAVEHGEQRERAVVVDVRSGPAAARRRR